MDERDVALIATAESYRDLRAVAVDVLVRMRHAPRIQVCGPISTGGLGSPEKNTELLRSTIRRYEWLGLNVFDQTVFEPRIKHFYNPGDDGYDWRILDEFYMPIFECRLVDELHFLPGFHTSIGASWEHEQAMRLGLKVVYLEAERKAA